MIDQLVHHIGSPEGGYECYQQYGNADTEPSKDKLLYLGLWTLVLCTIRSAHPTLPADAFDTQRTEESQVNIEMPSLTRKRKSRSQSQSPGDWVIAIPSYKRAETLRDKTLTVLRHYRIPRNRIHVFVANEAEAATYRAALDPATYGHLHVAEPGMAAVRNYITRFFPVGKQIFNMDDDIRGFIEYAAGARRNERPLRSLSAVITAGFREVQGTGFRLFGFYPVANGYFMKEGYTTDLKYIIGSVWGIVNPGKVLTVTIDDKEDYLRSIIMYLLDGGVIRYNNVAPQSAYYKEPGGMQETRTMSRITASAKAMTEAFPDLTTINLTKKSGMPELRLRDKRPEGARKFGESALRSYTMPRPPSSTK